MQAEASYDWKQSDTSVPVTVFVGSVLRIGGLPVQIIGGPRYFVSHFDNGPKGWGARLSVTMMFPATVAALALTRGSWRHEARRSRKAGAAGLRSWKR